MRPPLLSLPRLLLALPLAATLASAAAPMANLPGIAANPAQTDFTALPYLKGEHALISQGDSKMPLRDHAYLAFYDGKYWCMWSNGPVIEDHPGQYVAYANSRDGLHWSGPRQVVGPPPEPGFRWIARGFWIRDGRLLAIASHDEALDAAGRTHFFGVSLKLFCFAWDPMTGAFTKLGQMADNAISNYPPIRLANGDWAMICRDHVNNIFFYHGGVASPLDWKSAPIAPNRFDDGAKPEEPTIAVLPDHRVIGLFRDNNGSKRIYRAFAHPDGSDWTKPERTNFPDATCKIGLFTLDSGHYILVNNPSPLRRNPLCLAISADGITYTRIARLPVTIRSDGGPIDARNQGRSYKYPGFLEHAGSILIAYARDDHSIEVIKLPTSEVEGMLSE